MNIQIKFNEKDLGTEVYPSEHDLCWLSFNHFFNNYIKLESNDDITLHDHQKDLISLLHKENFVISKFPRRAGLTTLIAAYALWLLMFRRVETILCLSKTDAEAVKLNRMIRGFIDRLPEEFSRKFTKRGDYSIKSDLTNSDILSFSVNNGYRKSVSYFLVDDAAMTMNLWVGYRPIIREGGRVLVAYSSFQSDWLGTTLEEAKLGISGFKPFEVDEDDLK